MIERKGKKEGKKKKEKKKRKKKRSKHSRGSNQEVCESITGSPSQLRQLPRPACYLNSLPNWSYLTRLWGFPDELFNHFEVITIIESKTISSSKLSSILVIRSEDIILLIEFFFIFYFLSVRNSYFFRAIFLSRSSLRILMQTTLCLVETEGRARGCPSLKISLIYEIVNEAGW